MALDQNSRVIPGWVDAEVAERVRFGQSKFEKIAQGLIAANNSINTIKNAWAKGTDIWDHFATLPQDVNLRHGEWGAKRSGSSGTVTVVELDHYVRLGIGTPAANISASHVWSPHKRRIDRVASDMTARVRVSSWGFALARPGIGFTSDHTVEVNAATPPADGAWFEIGTNANTWKCITRSGGAVQTTTDFQAGNYTSWDDLKVEFLVASVKFFINDTLVATHTSNLPTAVGLTAFVNVTGAGTEDVELDLAVLEATENAVSP